MELLMELQLQTAKQEQDKEQLQQNIVQQQQLEEDKPEQHETPHNTGAATVVESLDGQKHEQQHEVSKVQYFDPAALPPGVSGGLRLLSLQLWLQIVMISNWCAPRTFAEV